MYNKCCGGGGEIRMADMYIKDELQTKQLGGEVLQLTQRLVCGDRFRARC